MAAPINTLPPIPPIIAQLTGPLLLGHFFNWGLFGSLVVQTYIYYLAFPHDRWLPKAIVGSAFIIELLQTVLATRDAFRNFGSGWGDMNALEEVGWLWFSVPVLGSIIACMEQIFFCLENLDFEWKFNLATTRNCFFQGVAGIWSGVYSHFIGAFSEVPKHTKNITPVWLGGTALCDVIIAASMIFYLNNSRTGFRQTNVLLTKIIRITIETGLTCATFAILDLAFLLAFKDNNYHLAPSIALSKLYSNSLVVVLNSRVRMVNGRETRAPALDMTLSTIAPTKSVTLDDSMARPTNGRNVISVSVSQEFNNNSVELDTVGQYKKRGNYVDLS
ncbi:hypothetical protein ONZ45_g14255 [Pleurotus djamor]|nr:hypothetical protein ONZ45_g14255 [Pleurotus djamor]